MRLHEVSDQYAHVLEHIGDPKQFEALADTLESIDAIYEEKLEQVTKSRANDLAEVAALEEEIKRLKGRADAAMKRAENKEKYIKFSLLKNNQRNVKTATYSFSFKKSTSLKVVDLEKFPKNFLKPQPPKADIAGIKKYLKETFDEKNIPCPDDLPELGLRFEHNENLQIK